MDIRKRNDEACKRIGPGLRLYDYMNVSGELCLAGWEEIMVFREKLLGRAFWCFPLMVGLSAGAAGTGAAEPGVSVTIYNQNFGLVKDVRSLELVQGNQEIRIDDVAAAIDATSVHFTSLNKEGVAVLEQNYQYDLAGADRLLNRYLNQSVSATMKDGSVREGTLLSHDGRNVVLATDNGVSILNSNEVTDLSLGDIPGGLVVKPTLVWDLWSQRAGSAECQISYLTNQINWHAEYVAIVDENDKNLDLSGWVSVDNKSGATYEDAKLKLVAGDVNRVQDAMVPRARGNFQAMDMVAAVPEQFQSNEFFEYHIYTMQRPATIRDRETKQLSLFPSAKTEVKKVLTYDGARRPDDVTVDLEFKNSSDNGLGMPLPAGKLRVFKEDRDGALEFVGEDRIDHTPKDEKLRVYLGNSFDVKGERKRSDYRKISNRSQEESFEIEIRNHKKEHVTVVIVEHLRSDWKILKESHSHKKVDSHKIEYVVQVAPDETANVTYTVRTSW